VPLNNNVAHDFQYFEQRKNRPAIEKLIKQSFAKGRTTLGTPTDITGIKF
jgi:hypothetical protein